MNSTKEHQIFRRLLSPKFHVLGRTRTTQGRTRSYTCKWRWTCTCGACIVMLNARVKRAVFSHEMYRSPLYSFSSSSSLLEPTCIYGRKRNSSFFAFIFLKGLTFLVPVLKVAFSLLMLISCCSGRWRTVCPFLRWFILTDITKLLWSTIFSSTLS